MRNCARVRGVSLVGGVAAALFLVVPAFAQAPTPPPPEAMAPAPASAQPAAPEPSASARTDVPAVQTQAPAPGGLKIEGSGASLKLGFLLQPATEYQSEAAGSPDGQQYFFLRRARLMFGLTVGSNFEVFAETDTPNLGRPVNEGATFFNTVGTNIQDVFLTWKPLEQFKVDAGMMLIPFSHNSDQSAATLLGWDYYSFVFQQNEQLGSYVWRDTGVQLRGLLAKHLEYRVGAFSGKRRIPPAPMPGTAAIPLVSRLPVRVAARVQYNVFDPETSFFYAGTYGGTKKVLSVGAGVDRQDDYMAYAADAFLDWPLGDDVVSAQVVFSRYDGGSWIVLPARNAIMVEAGYRLGALKLSPIVRVEQLVMDTNTPMAPDVTRYSAGLAWWYMGHNANLKLFYTRVNPTGSAQLAYNQVNLQMQLFVF